ncbi:MAG: formyltransferase family protein [candidate division Zixibacteria bacterium]|nr:formyltransferase family protein [candidate division Zixibacteria bacterium]
MDNHVYVVATIKPWNIEVYNKIIKNYPGEWHLISEPQALTVDKIKSIAPKYIFFPHWNHIVPAEILDIATCVCFHETDLPYGRGGSPLQNLIARGHRETVVTALRMSDELDAGPVYLKRPLSLEGLAEEIFIRAAHTVAEMIKTIITENPEPKQQTGKSTLFTRRKPGQSKIPTEINRLADLFDHIRMLDAHSYPRAFLESGGFRYEISRPALKTGEILADVRITEIEGDGND